MTLQITLDKLIIIFIDVLIFNKIEIFDEFKKKLANVMRIALG